MSIKSEIRNFDITKKPITRYDLEWEIGDCGTENNTPETMIPATVPGNIQCDFAKYYNYADHNYGDNFKQFDWMEKNYFLYEAKLPEIENGKTVYIWADGIDYEYDILINNDVIYHHEGMFTKLRLDITEYLKGNDKLNVLIYPVPLNEKVTMERDHANQTCKPAVSYGWDFHPRVVPRGIWEPFEIVVTDGYCITDWDINTVMSNELDFVTGEFKADLDVAGDYELSLTITTPDGEEVFANTVENDDIIYFSVTEPELWWPSGYGQQYLYNFEVVLSKSGVAIQVINFRRGFRDIKLKQYEGIWLEQLGYPKRCNSQPITFYVNNKPIFAQGTNWVCPEIFYANLNRERYEEILLLIKNANMNIVRCWGGAIVNKDSFFELCDELGLLVWQEFPLSCNFYHGTPKYLKTLDEESKSIIKRVKKFTCLALWCGGNELFNEWSGMNMQEPAIRLIDSNCFKYDPKTPFIPTSPIYEMMHGHYSFYDRKWKVEVFEMFNTRRATGYCEAGINATSRMETLKKYLPEESLNKFRPEDKDVFWDLHHIEHLDLDNIERYFGKQDKIEDVVKLSGMLQQIGYKYIYEESRRQSPKCSIVMNWCFNEPWPCAANDSIVEYDNTPKPGYYAICEALRDSMPSMRYDKFEYTTGEELKMEIWWLTKFSTQLDGKINVYLNTDEGRVLIGSSDNLSKQLEHNEKIFDLSCTLNMKNTQMFCIDVEGELANGECIKSDYKFHYKAQ